MVQAKSTGVFGFLLVEVALALCMMALAMGVFVSLYGHIVYTVHHECERVRRLEYVHRQVTRMIESFKGQIQPRIPFTYFLNVGEYHLKGHNGLGAASKDDVMVEVNVYRDTRYPCYVHVEVRGSAGQLVLYAGYVDERWFFTA